MTYVTPPALILKFNDFSMGSSLSSTAPPALPPAAFLSPPTVEPYLCTPSLLPASLPISFYCLMTGLALSLLCLGVWPAEVVLSPLSPAALLSLLESLALGNGFLRPG